MLYLKSSLKVLFGALLLLFAIDSKAQTNQTVTVLAYNILNFPNANNSNPLGNDAARSTYFRQIVESANADVIIIQEMKSLTGATLLVNELNANGTLGKTYNHAPGYTSYSGLGNMLVYNDDLFDFVAQQELPRNNTAIAPDGSTVISPRAVSRYQLEMSSLSCGQNVVIPIEFYSLHLKAGNSGPDPDEIADNDRRNLGVLDLMDFINTLPITTNIVAAGDMNFQDESPTAEPGYTSFTSSSNAQALTDVLGSWTRNSAADADEFTQSTRQGGSSSAYGNNGTNGGLDDRFDFIFFNGAINNNSNNVSYIANSYETYGSPQIVNGDATDGTFFLEDEIRQMSDHYPVKMDLNVALPAPTFTACNDNDPCTVSDSLDINCNCVGIYMDSDSDGVCDPLDVCAGFNDALIGTPCSDGNFCTTNDTYDGSCNCVGVFADSDNDGVCDNLDACPNLDDNLINTACNDNNPCTINDTYDDNCNCIGTSNDSDGDGVCDALDVCAGFDDNLIGTPCSDGNFCTTNDTYDGSCNCVGVFADSDNDGVCDNLDACPNLNDNLINTACNDNDPCTINDTYDDNCNCIGTFTDSDNDGVCDSSDACPNFDDGLIGTSCNDNNACTINDTYDGSCNCIGTFTDSDNDGVCDASDACPNFNDGLIGTSCNDNNACTINDTYDGSCNCVGTFQDSDGDGVCDASDACPNFNDGLIGTPCNDNNACTINDTYDGSCNCVGTFQDSDGDGVCDASDACPNFNDGLIGTPCNDNNACTINDTYDGSCNCVGTFQDSDGDGVCDASDVCPNFNDGLIGTSCNDNNVCTINDTYDGSCNCVGTFQDADGDGVCDASDVCPNFDDGLIGTPCDDGDPNTQNDLYDSNCNCLGTPLNNSCMIEIPLQTGWNLISSYCEPSNLAMESIFAAIANNTIQVKDLTDTYVPSFNFNNIGNWDITSGYQVKMLTADTLVITGTLVDPLTTEIILQPGWNLGAYLLTVPSGPYSIWNDIAPNTIQIKDLTGSFIPSFNFSDIGTLNPTQGFQFKMSVADTLIYNPSNVGFP